MAACLLLVLSCAAGVWGGPADDDAAGGQAVTVHIPALTIDHRAAHDAFRIAIGDLLGNVQLYQDGLLDQPVPVILAGLEYDTPWTRDAAINAWFEQTEFSAADDLFRGAGWSDGVAAYPDAYADAGGSSGILDWPRHNPDQASRPGYGIPMMALSTNCLYYNAYVTAEQMARELQIPVDPHWASMAARLYKAINLRLWVGW